jgi:hypothetical protein
MDSYLKSLVPDLKNELKNYTKVKYIVIEGVDHMEFEGDTLRDVLEDYYSLNFSSSNGFFGDCRWLSSWCVSLLNEESELWKYMKQKGIKWECKHLKKTDEGKYLWRLEQFPSYVADTLPVTEMEGFPQGYSNEDVEDCIVGDAFRELPEDFLMEVINKNIVPLEYPHYFIEAKDPIIEFFKIGNYFHFTKKA